MIGNAARKRPFTSKTPLNQDEKNHPPNLRILLSVSTPYQGGCDVNFTP